MSTPALTLTANGTSSITTSLSFTPPAGLYAKSYELQRSLDGVSGWTTLDTPAVFLGTETLLPPFYNNTPTKFVGKTGPFNNTTTFSSIQAAIDAAVAGDVIAVGPGTYSEIVNISKSGTATQPIIIRAEFANQKPVIDGGYMLPTGGRQTDCLEYNINPDANKGPAPLRACSANTSSPNKGGMILLRGEYIIWDSIDVINSRGAGMFVGNLDEGNGYFDFPPTRYKKGIQILRSRIDGARQNNVHAVLVEDFIIGGCQILNGNNAMFYDRSFSAGAGDFSNTASYHWGGGLVITGKNIKVHDNDIGYQFGEGLHVGVHSMTPYTKPDGTKVVGFSDQFAQNVSIRRNRVFDCWTNLVYFTNCRDVEFDGNVVYFSDDKTFWNKLAGNFESPDFAIDFGCELGSFDRPTIDGQGSWNVRVTNNIIYGGGFAGLTFSRWKGSRARNILISNNTFVNPRTSGYLLKNDSSAQNVFNEPMIQNVTLQNNIFYATSQNLLAEVWNPSSNFIARNNLWSHTPPESLRGSGDIVNSNVGLVNPNYRIGGTTATNWPNRPTFDVNAMKLTVNSPAIGKGYADSSIRQDFFGVDRTKLTPMDIGACEFATQAVVTPNAPYTKTDTALNPGTTYYYRARVTLSNDTVSNYSSVTNATTTQIPVPVLPTLDRNNGKLEAVSGAYGTFIGNGFVLDGEEDFISTTQKYTGAQISSFTVGAWFRTTDLRGRKIIGFENNRTSSSNSYDRMLYVGTDGRLYFGNWNGSPRIITSVDSVADGTWYYAVGTYHNNVMKLYLNGTKIGELALTAPPAAYDGYWKIGGFNLAGWPLANVNGYFKGTVGPTHVYQRELTDTEIMANYTAKRASFVSNYPATVTPTVTPNGVTLGITGAVSTSGLTYVVQRAATSSGPWKTLPSNTSGTVNDQDIQVSNTYYYRARIIEGNKNTEWSGVKQATTSANPVAPPVTGPTTPISGTGFNPGWPRLGIYALDRTEYYERPEIREHLSKYHVVVFTHWDGWQVGRSITMPNVMKDIKNKAVKNLAVVPKHLIYFMLESMRIEINPALLADYTANIFGKDVFTQAVVAKYEKSSYAIKRQKQKIDQENWWYYQNGSTGKYSIPGMQRDTIHLLPMMSSLCPKDANGDTWPTWAAKFCYTQNKAGEPNNDANPYVDGIFWDNFFAWAYVYRSKIDFDRNGTPDSQFQFGRQTREGLLAAYNELKRLWPNAIQVGNIDWLASLGDFQRYNNQPVTIDLPNHVVDTSVFAPVQNILDGTVMEYALDEAEVNADGATARPSYARESYAGIVGLKNLYRTHEAVTIGDKLMVFFDHQAFLTNDAIGRRKARFGMAACWIMGNAYLFQLSERTGYSVLLENWADEYDNGGTKMEWMGQPTMPAQDAEFYENKVWRRDFENAVVLMNPRGNGVKTVTLPFATRRIAGREQYSDTTVNNGALIAANTSITLQDRDGLVLVRVTPVSITPGNPPSVTPPAVPPTVTPPVVTPPPATVSPPALRVSNVTSTQATVEVTAPANVVAPIASYTVSRSTGGGSTPTAVYQGENPVFVDSGLAPGTTYYYSATMTLSNGDNSGDSAQAVASTQGGSVVVGTGTRFLSYEFPVETEEGTYLTRLQAGDSIVINNETRIITNIESDTVLYVDQPFGTGNAGGSMFFKVNNEYQGSHADKIIRGERYNSVLPPTRRWVKDSGEVFLGRIPRAALTESELYSAVLGPFDTESIYQQAVENKQSHMFHLLKTFVAEEQDGDPDRNNEVYWSEGELPQIRAWLDQNATTKALPEAFPQQLSSSGFTALTASTSTIPGTQDPVYLPPVPVTSPYVDKTVVMNPTIIKAKAVFSAGVSVTNLENWNVSSIVRVALGVYTINFKAPFSSANYAVVGICTEFGGFDPQAGAGVYILEQTTSSVTITITAAGEDNGDANFERGRQPFDPSRVSVIVAGFRT